MPILGSNSNMRRGALIVLEGCDRAGKTTQCKKLVQSLTSKSHHAEFTSFPDRSTSVGKILDNYLAKREDMPDRAIHLLFAANRWELEPKMLTSLNSGTTLVIDRYSYSGVAFSAAKEGMDLEWCWKPELGLPKPDVVFFLKLSPEAMARRGGFGDERYENTEFQQKVACNFKKLQDPSWITIDADKDAETLHQEILGHVLNTIKQATDEPISRLS